jgi:hypothetical protein
MLSLEYCKALTVILASVGRGTYIYGVRSRHINNCRFCSAIRSWQTISSSKTILDLYLRTGRWPRNNTELTCDIDDRAILISPAFKAGLLLYLTYPRLPGRPS